MVERIRTPSVWAGGLVGAALLALSCASTTIKTTWVDASYGGGPFKKVFVMGLSARDVTGRRVFEDIMVRKLEGAGLQAVPAYRSLPGPEIADEPALQTAVEQSGADGLLMSRLLGIDTQVMVDPGMESWYRPYHGWYAGPEVTPEVTRTARVETSLYSVATKKMVWMAVSETFNPGTVQEEAPGLADAVIRDLRSRGLVAAR